MSEIKFTDVIRCSSEDPIHSSSNLLKGSSNHDYWLCSRDNKESTIEVELQFAKEVVIAFIDIGNYGSQTVDILVSHSTRSRDQFVSLVPTFNFMSVAESKQAINRKNVQMFTGDNMMSDSKMQAWDRLKLVCRQPYSNGKQFGLSFICVKMARGGEDMSKTISDDKNQNKLNDFFDTLRNTSSPITKPKLSMWSSTLSPKISNLKSPMTPKLNEYKSTISPTDNDKSDQLNLSSDRKTPKRVLSGAAIAQFREEVSCFLEDVNFKELMKARTIKVSDLRNQMEKQRGLALMQQQKILFMEIITERLKKIKQSKVLNGNMISPSNHSSEIKNTDYDEECKKCHVKLPKSIISIHSKMCNPATPIRPKKAGNRNQLCFDLGNSSEDEDENPRKRTKINNNNNNNNKTAPSPIPNNLNKSPIPNGTVSTSGITTKCSVKIELCALLTTGNSNSGDPNTLDNIRHSLDTETHVKQSSVSPRSSDAVVKSQTGSISQQRKSSINDDTQYNVASSSEGDVHRKLTNAMRSPLSETARNSTTNAHRSLEIDGTEDNAIHILEETDTTECPICFQQIPCYKIAMHASSCEGGMDHDGDDDLPEISFKSTFKHTKCPDDNISKTIAVNQVQCPICGKMMDKENVEVHVNVCLDISTINCGEMSD